MNIAYIYPDLLNLYGDKGNIECMRKRLMWRGFEVNIIAHESRSGEIDLSAADIVFIGGGSDREQEIAAGKLISAKDEFKDYVERGGVLLAICGGYQLLGKYYKTKNSRIEGLDVLDIYTESSARRLIGNIVIKNDLFNQCIVGFENHSGRTYIGNYMPLGEVIAGYGNNEESKSEGILYKNVVATYMHGPLLPKNPQLCDYILLKAIQNKCPDVETLSELDDTIEMAAKNYISRRLIK